MMFVLVAKICKWFAKFCTKEPNSISSVGSCFHSKLNFYCEPEGKRKGLLSQQKNMHLLWKIPTWLKSIGTRFLILFQKCYQKQLLFSFIWQFIQVSLLHFVFPAFYGCWPLNFPKNWPPGGRNLKILIFGSFQTNLAKKWILDYKGPRGSFLAEFHGQ